MKAAKILITLLIIIFSGAISYYLYEQIETSGDTMVREIEEETIVKGKLAFSVNESLEVGKESTMNIVLDTNIYEVTGVDLAIKYNADEVEILEIQDGNVFDAVYHNSVEKDKVLYSASVELGKSYTGSDVIAMLKIKPKKVGTLTLSFFTTEEEATFVTYVGAVNNTEVPMSLSVGEFIVE